MSTPKFTGRLRFQPSASGAFPADLRTALEPFVGCQNTPHTRASIEQAVHAIIDQHYGGRPFQVVGEDDTLAVNVMPNLPMDEATFTALVGRPPIQDDLDRVNCPKAGALTHWQCGWCLAHYQPRFECGCIGKGA